MNVDFTRTTISPPLGTGSSTSLSSIFFGDIKNTDLLDRNRQFQTRTAAERYSKFCDEFPQIALNVPLGHIATYLGMDIATLSRLRNKR